MKRGREEVQRRHEVLQHKKREESSANSANLTKACATTMQNNAALPRLSCAPASRAGSNSWRCSLRFRLFLDRVFTFAMFRSALLCSALCIVCEALPIAYILQNISAIFARLHFEISRKSKPIVLYSRILLVRYRPFVRSATDFKVGVKRENHQSIEVPWAYKISLFITRNAPLCTISLPGRRERREKVASTKKKKNTRFAGKIV